MDKSIWLTQAKVILPTGIIPGAVCVSGGRIRAIRSRAPRGAAVLSLHGATLSPGLIDLHVWGPPDAVAKDAARAATTGFLTTLGPELKSNLLDALAWRTKQMPLDSAQCLGFHLEGPFVNPKRSGALPRRGMRAPTLHELDLLQKKAGGKLCLITLAPELPGAAKAIRWCRKQGIQVSLGHTIADAETATEAVNAGAGLVTHIFNGMPGFHHRTPSLLDVALTDDRLTAMVIADGVHVSAASLKLLVRVKGVHRIALVTDSIRRQGWDVVAKRGAYFTRSGVLAGSQLTLLRAVQNMVELAGVSLVDAVGMASEVPARVLGLQASRGTIAVGKRADLAAFDSDFKVQWTMAGGRLVYQRGKQ